MNQSPLAIALMLAIGATTPSMVLADSAPTAPSNLTAKLYSGAGGEIFWNRSTDDRGIRGYDITRNGTNLGVRDATSFYDASLQAGTGYTFTVTAIDSSGQRSATSTVKIGNAPVNPATPATPLTPVNTVVPITPPVAGAPDSPAGLRASVYSTSNAELFWTRSTKPGLRYEVRRDGNLVTTTDGTSYYASGLAAGRNYAYQVIAIDSSGKRSSPASVAVAIGGGASTGNPLKPVTPDMAAIPGTPATSAGNTLASIQPKDVSIKIYSGTAAEIFWTPAGASRPVIAKNEIRRDGVLIATLQGEFLKSYFDGKREAGKSYRYEITAISSAGRASATVSDSGVSGPKPVVPVQNTDALPAALQTKLNTTFEIINGVPVEKVMATLGRLSDRNARASLGLKRTGERANRNGSLSDVFSCPKGGELLDTQDHDPSARWSSDVEIIDCAVGPIVFSASAQMGGPVTNSGWSPSSVNALNIELDDARDLSTITSESMFFFYGDTDARFSSYSGFDVSVDRVQNSYKVSLMTGNGRDQNNSLPDGTFGLTTNARNVAGVVAGTADMKTLGPLEFTNGRDNARPSGGRVQIGSASDNLLIDAFNGDPATFSLTATSGGATTSHTVKFSDTYRFEAPVTRTVIVGF